MNLYNNVSSRRDRTDRDDRQTEQDLMGEAERESNTAFSDWSTAKSNHVSQ